MALDPHWRNPYPNDRTVLVAPPDKVGAVLVLDVQGVLVDAEGGVLAGSDLAGEVAAWIERWGQDGSELPVEWLHPAIRADVARRARWGLRASKDERRVRKRHSVTLMPEALAKGAADAARAGVSFSSHVERLLLGGKAEP